MDGCCYAAGASERTDGLVEIIEIERCSAIHRMGRISREGVRIRGLQHAGGNQRRATIVDRGTETTP